MCVNGVAVGMREDDGPADVLHHLHRRAPAGVRAAWEHSHARHFVEHLAAEKCETAIVVLTAAADGVVAVVGHEHPFDAQRVKELDHAQLIAECTGAFQIEAHAESPAALGLLHVGETVHQQVLLGMLLHEVAEVSEHPQVLLEASQVEADVERDDRQPGAPAALELRQERVVRPQRHARVVVPDHCVRPPGSNRLVHRAIVSHEPPAVEVNSSHGLHNRFLRIDAGRDCPHPWPASSSHERGIAREPGENPGLPPQL